MLFEIEPSRVEFQLEIKFFTLEFQRQKPRSHTNPEQGGNKLPTRTQIPRPAPNPNLPTAVNPRPLIFSKNNKPRQIQRDTVFSRVERILFCLRSFQEAATRLLLPHAFRFCVWFPPSLCFSSNCLFFLFGLDLMMLRWVGFDDALLFFLL